MNAARAERVFWFFFVIKKEQMILGVKRDKKKKL
jgi:hypothetical protein